ncbi:MAG: hypothetical protein ACYS6K_22110, partial [Planctomycetota bacterium]
MIIGIEEWIREIEYPSTLLRTYALLGVDYLKGPAVFQATGPLVFVRLSWRWERTLLLYPEIRFCRSPEEIPHSNR